MKPEDDTSDTMRTSYFDLQRGNSVGQVEEWIASLAKEPIPKSMRILCFGDSTLGNTKADSHSYSYGNFLRTRLPQLLPNCHIHIDVEELPGEQIRHSYFRRLKSKLEPNLDSPLVPYDWIIVSGGTKDLGSDRLPLDVYYDLGKSHPCAATIVHISRSKISQFFAPSIIWVPMPS